VQYAHRAGHLQLLQLVQQKERLSSFKKLQLHHYLTIVHVVAAQRHTPLHINHTQAQQNNY
jgi:hypothetical protein